MAADHLEAFGRAIAALRPEVVTFFMGCYERGVYRVGADGYLDEVDQPG